MTLTPRPYGNARYLACGACGQVYRDFGEAVTIYPAMEVWHCPNCQGLMCSRCLGVVTGGTLTIFHTSEVCVGN